MWILENRICREGVNQIWLDILWRWWSIAIDSAPCSKVPCDVFYHFPLRLDVPAELSQMKIRDAGALRKKALDVQQKLDEKHRVLPWFTNILWFLRWSYFGHLWQVGVYRNSWHYLSRSDLLSRNHVLYISTGLHIYAVNVRVIQVYPFTGASKVSLSREGFVEVMGIGLPLISPERTWLLRLLGHAQFWTCFWDASSGCLVLGCDVSCPCPSISIRSWKSSPKYIQILLYVQNSICLVGFVQMVFSCRIWGIPTASGNPINYPSILRFPLIQKDGL